VETSRGGAYSTSFSGQSSLGGYGFFFKEFFKESRRQRDKHNTRHMGEQHTHMPSKPTEEFQISNMCLFCFVCVCVREREERS